MAIKYELLIHIWFSNKKKNVFETYCSLKMKVKVDSIQMRTRCLDPYLQELQSAYPERRSILHNDVCLDLLESINKTMHLL